MENFFRLILAFLERPKVQLSLGVILLILGTIFLLNLPTLGEPVRKTKSGNTTTRYWSTEEERERAITRKENGGISFSLLFGGCFLIGFGIKGLIKINKI